MTATSYSVNTPRRLQPTTATPPAAKTKTPTVAMNSPSGLPQQQPVSIRTGAKVQALVAERQQLKKQEETKGVRGGRKVLSPGTF